MLRGLSVWSIAGLLLAVACLEARAEVSVRTNRRGEYLGTRVIATGPQSDPRVWTVRSRMMRRAAILNPEGDANGDLWPSVAEARSAPYAPWVAWSRFHGNRYDLAWSRWSEGEWAPIQWVYNGSTMALGDDLDADIAFDDSGRPYMVWWRDRPAATDRILVSVFLANSWMKPFPVSDRLVGSRYPTIWEIRSSDDGSVEIDVRYETAEGHLTQTVAFEKPDTITDDINPQGRFQRIGVPVHVNGSGN